MVWRDLAVDIRKAEVKWLVKFLRVPPSKLTRPSSFEERLRVQKAVFLLKHLGISPFSQYAFSLYMSGPYSPDLARDYYALSETRAKSVELEPKTGSMLKWFTSKDRKWLEVASSIISIKETYPEAGSERVHSVLTMSKPWVNEELFKSVMDELVGKDLIPET